MIYCDASLLISIFTTEEHSDTARSWYLADDQRRYVVSDWVATEIVSALAKKQRMGFLDDHQRATAERAWAAMKDTMLTVPVEPHHFSRAAVLVDVAPRGLRAGDALHLAIVLDHGHDLAPFDRDLADAARALGVAVHP